MTATKADVYILASIIHGVHDNRLWAWAFLGLAILLAIGDARATR